MNIDNLLKHSNNNQPIAVFDSGIGGLFSLKILKEKLPQEDFIYIADCANLPYGNKKPEQIIEFSNKIFTFLIEKFNPKLIIIACNTSSAIALNLLKKNFCCPIIDIINPFIEQINFNNKKIGVIATEATINSNFFQDKILANWPFGKVFGQACPEFVPLIEGGLVADKCDDVEKIVKIYLEEILKKDIEYLVYGCTHYPYLENIILKNLPSKVEIINPVYNLVTKVENFLFKNGLVNQRNFGLGGTTNFFNTGCEEIFSEKIKFYLQENCLSKKISI